MIELRTALRPCVLAVALAGFAAGCAGARKDAAPASAPAEEPAAADKKESGKSYDEADDDGDARQPGLEGIVAANNDFAFDLYQVLRSDQFAIAPISVAATVALIHGATHEASAQEIAATLRWRDPESAVHDRHQRLRTALDSRRTARSDAARGFRLWSPIAVGLHPSVQATDDLRRVGQNYAASFIEVVEGQSAKTMNAFFADATGGAFEQALGAVGTDEQVVFATTTHWDAPWEVPFERALTKSATFQTLTGASRVQMMDGRMRTAYLAGEGFSLIELPYGGGQVSAWVIAPDANDFDATLTADYFEWMVKSARQTDLHVRLPKFDVASRHDLVASLQTMGARAVFAECDESTLRGFRSTSARCARVDKVVSNVHVRIDEDGTNAASTTRGSVISHPGKRLPLFEVNRPFVVIVRDNPTGSIIAMARITNP